ncbi:hypothetical protein [Streptomyces melanogenes]|uniref:hypothetical protein n=1 Tax=Streptomyces melanogenes TaxID=67326 RepID=UPI00379D877E
MFSVQGEDPDEVTAALARMCRLLGLEVSLSATRSVGTGRYMARGVPVRPVPQSAWEREV